MVATATGSGMRVRSPMVALLQVRQPEAFVVSRLGCTTISLSQPGQCTRHFAETPVFVASTGAMGRNPSSSMSATTASWFHSWGIARGRHPRPQLCVFPPRMFEIVGATSAWQLRQRDFQGRWLPG